MPEMTPPPTQRPGQSKGRAGTEVSGGGNSAEFRTYRQNSRNNRSQTVENVIGKDLTDILPKVDGVKMETARIHDPKSKNSFEGSYISELDGEKEGPATEDNRKKGYGEDENRKKNDNRNNGKKPGFGYHVSLADEHGNAYLIMEERDGMFYAPPFEYIKITVEFLDFMKKNKLHFAIFETDRTEEVHPGNTILLYTMSREEQQNYIMRTENLTLAFKFDDPIFKPPRLGNVSGKVGRRGYELDLHWKENKVNAYRNWDGRPNIEWDDFGHMDGLSPKLMQLAKELEAKNKQAKTMSWPSLAPMNVGFVFAGRRPEVQLADEGLNSFDADKMPAYTGQIHYARYAQKEMPASKMVEIRGAKTVQTASTENRTAETLVSPMQKIGQSAQTVLQGMKTGTAAAEMQVGNAQQLQKHGGMAAEKHGVAHKMDMPSMTFTPLSERHFSFVQSAGESRPAHENRTEPKSSTTVQETAAQEVRQTATQMGVVSAVVETAQDMQYQAGQTMTQEVRNYITPYIPVLVTRAAAQVVAAEPMMLKIAANESSEKKTKTGRKSALVIVAVPVAARKKKNAAIVPNKTVALMENKKARTGKITDWKKAA